MVALVAAVAAVVEQMLEVLLPREVMAFQEAAAAAHIFQDQPQLQEVTVEQG